ncbi:hydroxyethylthiazole kinase [Caldimonas sp.]|uniref:hydroxyethylthiazole kinase n=1 Tax=Caldimonas sp. TaxID=2838790 RepID=UPI00391DFFD9
MLISPSFVPEQGAMSEDAWLDAALSGCDHGLFPVSHHLGWHGGRHLQAPHDGATSILPVCAIADGTVLYVRQRSATPALTYAGGYHSDGVVVLRHDTEIGADTQNRPVRLRYYSVSMHLHRIEPTVRVGQRLHRQDPLGQAGHILGQPNVFQLTICLDDENLQRLLGRPPGALDAQRHGRTDVIYGDAYVRLPEGTPVYAQDPGTTSRPPAGAVVLMRSAEPWIVGLHHERGAIELSTYDAAGQVLGRVREDAPAEYALYERAWAMSRAWSAALGQPVAPAACYELLRWARVLGPQPLPAAMAHWRRIATPRGSGWVNLNAADATRFSDADFPPWRGWQCIDDSRDGDSRCDSAHIWQLLDANGDGRLGLEEAQARLARAEVRARLARTICKFPSEWDASTLEQRWGWLRQPSAHHPSGMDEQAWQRFCAHARALCFDCPELFQARWHVDARAFIGQMRRCGWRSREELVQLVPSHAIRTTTRNGHRAVMWEQVPESSVDVQRNPVLQNHLVPLNKMLRAYGIDTPMRQACFFGNAIQETGWLRNLAEAGGQGLWYAPWYGRGFLQLTGPGNYCEYWRWRGREVPQALQRALEQAYETTYRLPASQRNNERLRDVHFPQLTQQMVQWRDHLEGRPDPRLFEEQWAPSDSAGFYWLKSGMARHADQAHEVQRCEVSTNQGFKVYYRSAAFWRASAAVNLPAAVERLYSPALNGFDSRCCAYGVALAVLTEMRLPDAQGALTLRYPEGYTRRRWG